MMFESEVMSVGGKLGLESWNIWLPEERGSAA